MVKQKTKHNPNTPNRSAHLKFHILSLNTSLTAKLYSFLNDPKVSASQTLPLASGCSLDLSYLYERLQCCKQRPVLSCRRISVRWTEGYGLMPGATSEYPGATGLWGLLPLHPTTKLRSTPPIWREQVIESGYY